MWRTKQKPLFAVWEGTVEKSRIADTQYEKCVAMHK